jgi:transcriptional regulator with XRE-family HTH domain
VGKSRSEAEFRLAIGRQVSDRRLARGWTLRQLAAECGRGIGYLSDLENGKRSAGAETLVMLADVFGCTLDALVSGFASPANADPSAVCGHCGGTGRASRGDAAAIERN